MSLTSGTSLGPYRIDAPLGARRMGTYLVVCFGVAVLVGGCSSTSEVTMGPTAPSRTLTPGETLPLGETVRVSMSGDYPLPSGANRLTTRCTGSVTVSFTTPSGSEMNTCESADGSANQTNTVTGATQVTFALGTGAFADVTVD